MRNNNQSKIIPDVLTRETMHIILNFDKDPSLRVLVYCMYYSGQRMNDVIHYLKSHDIKIQKNNI
jgi:hypothetical protein